MNIFTAISFLNFMACLMGASKYTGSKMEQIIGGSPVDIDEYPHLAAFFNAGGICGSSILNSWSVLTAAHCFMYNKDVTYMNVQTDSAYLYKGDSTVYDVVAIKIHPDFNKTIEYSNDVAVVFVDGPIKFSRFAKKSVLIDTNEWMQDRGHNFEVSGWGYTQYEGDLSDLGLLTARLGFVPASECMKMHNRSLLPGMFCLYGGAKRDACRGDSGGGVIWNGMVVGIVSHGYKCNLKNRPSIYADVYYFRHWIQKTVNDYFKIYCN